MLNSGLLPQHLGIIMDGNGRWAQQRNLPRSMGHKEGLKSAKAIVKAVSEIGIPYLSLYVFSTENWKRTEEEVSFLMNLLKSYLKKEYQFYLENQIRVVHSGDLSSLPLEIRNDIQEIDEKTRNFEGTTVNLLINYGGRDEIIRAFNHFLTDNDSRNISEKELQKYFDQPQCPPLDLIIRTAGEKRLSNFMIWQAAYAEYYFSDTLWPDFNKELLENALMDYEKRNRKFGGY